MSRTEKPSFLHRPPSERGRLYLDNHKIVDDKGAVVREAARIAINRYIEPVATFPPKRYNLDPTNAAHEQTMVEFNDIMTHRQWLDEQGELPDTHLHDRLTSAYGDSVVQMIALRQKSSAIYQQGFEEKSNVHKRTIGNLTEQTVFALGSRHILGEPEDPWTVIPATAIQDQQPSKQGELGIRQGYDFTFVRRSDGQLAKVQVKTTDLGVASEIYDKAILTISLEAIAGSKKSCYELQGSIIQEVMQTDDSENTELIDQSYTRLMSAVSNHIDAGLTEYPQCYGEIA